MKGDRTTAIVLASFVVLAIAGPWLPQWAMFIMTVAFARGLGEFGATIMFAGSLQRVTQTLPLAIYAQFEVNFDVTLAISALLILISAALLASLKLSSLWQPSRLPSRSLFGLSASS